MQSLDQINSHAFSGHESFPFRHSWLKKGYDALCDDPAFFSHAGSHVELGVGKNMLYSIRHWLSVFGLAESNGEGRGRTQSLLPTPLAHQIFANEGWDPYLEDDGTLWLLQRALMTAQGKATTWWWAFHRPHTATIRRSRLLAELSAAADSAGWRASENTLKRDVECFFRTYLASVGSRGSQEDAISCPLTALGLIQPTSDKDEYILSYGWQPSLPQFVFCWGLGEFLDAVVHRDDTESGTISLDRLLHDEGAPGRVFRLNETALVARLALLAKLTDGHWNYDETVGLRQLVVRRRVPPLDWLELFYGETEPVQLAASGGAA